MDFRSGGTKRSANISPFLLRSLKAEGCDFLGENCSSARSFKKIDSTHMVVVVKKEKRNGNVVVGVEEEK